jgi:hypothetical protein
VQSIAFLDALAIGARREFDPEFAQAISNVLSEAVRVVEESQGPDVDKATPRTVHWKEHLPIQRRSAGWSNWELLRETAGATYEFDELSSVQRSEADHAVWLAGQGQEKLRLSFAQVFVVGGIPVATTVAGALLLIASAVSDPIVPNPYVALFALLSGLALLVTALVALRERPRE